MSIQLDTLLLVLGVVSPLVAWLVRLSNRMAASEAREELREKSIDGLRLEFHSLKELIIQDLQTRSGCNR